MADAEYVVIQGAWLPSESFRPGIAQLPVADPPTTPNCSGVPEFWFCAFILNATRSLDAIW